MKNCELRVPGPAIAKDIRPRLFPSLGIRLSSLIFRDDHKLDTLGSPYHPTAGGFGGGYPPRILPPIISKNEEQTKESRETYEVRNCPGGEKYYGPARIQPSLQK